MKDLNLNFSFTRAPKVLGKLCFGPPLKGGKLFIGQFNWGGFLLKSNGGVQRYTFNWTETNQEKINILTLGLGSIAPIFFF